METREIILWLLTCGPFVLVATAWITVYGIRRWQAPHPFGLVALGIVSANSILSAGTFLYYHFRPHSFLPPWEDPQILTPGLLFFLSPAGMALAAVAATQGTPKWLVLVMGIASLPLFFVGLMAVASV